MAFGLDQKSKNIAAYQKSIDENNVSIKRYYDEIGRLYYGQYKDISCDNTKDINTRCEAVTRLMSDNEQLNHKILFEKGLKLCPSCKTENNLEYTFCFSCGSKFDAKPADDSKPADTAPTADEPKAEPADSDAKDEPKDEAAAE